MTLPRSPISLVANSIIATKDAEQFGFDPRQLIFSVGEVLPETQAFVHFQPSTQTIWARKNGDLLHQKLTPSVTIPQFVWCSKDHGEWQVQWPRKKWGQALLAPTPVATHVVQLYQTSWSSDHC